MDNKKFKLQCLVFDKKVFSNRSVIKSWIKNNSYTIDYRLKQPIMSFDKTFRVRQRNPDWFNKKTFKVRNLSKGVKGVYGNIKR